MKNVAKLLALSAFLSSAPALAETPKWKISESSGTVNILRAGVSKIAITGGQLRPGDVVSTGRKSRAVLVRGQEYVVVSPGSRIRISEPQKSGGLFQFFNEVGNVLFRIDKKATPHFGVKTPYLAAVVKGTTFSVTVSETGTAVQVTEGAVQVSTNDGGAQHLLSPGMIGMVTQDQQFRLTITGTASKVIDSPNAPAGMKTGESDPVGDDPASEPSSEVVEIVDIAASGTEGVISSPVTDQPVSFSELTGGLVSDQPKENASVRLAMLDTGLTGSIPGNTGGANSDTPSQGILNGSNPGNETAATASGGNPPAGGGSGGNANGGGSASAGGNGNNKGSGNANGGGTANAGGGASNGGGNGNGGGSPAAGANGANGNGPANGGGNGAGNNGNGNGNGGSNGGGNGNGNNGNANGA
ncbi:FecR family protein, partial [Parasphingorhabdus marina DSM 22363]